MSRLPLVKTENIVVQKLESELLIYDLATNKVFCLNETSATVYQACNGQTDFDELKRKHHFTDDLIFFALDNLKKENLIKEDFISPLEGINRREVIKKIGLATVVALPVIASLIAPTAVQAAASCGGTLGAGVFLGCVPLEQNCLAMFQMCASCATTAAPEPLCPVNAPIGCACN